MGVYKGEPSHADRTRIFYRSCEKNNGTDLYQTLRILIGWVGVYQKAIQFINNSSVLGSTEVHIRFKYCLLICHNSHELLMNFTRWWWWWWWLLLLLLLVLLLLLLESKWFLAPCEDSFNEVDYAVHRVNHHPLNKALKIKVRYHCINKGEFCLIGQSNLEFRWPIHRNHVD